MTTDFPVTIYHNPKCGTSRNVVEMVKAAGYEPAVIHYAETGWTRDLLDRLMKDAGATPKDFLRTKGTPAEELGLVASDVSDETILEAMVREPVLVNRPVVVTPKGVKLCRPSEVVFDLLESKPASFTKEDGEVVVLS